jgi:hypothetical protein
MAKRSVIKEIKITELLFDNRNSNRGTELGKELLQMSIAKHGVGRGVLADKNLKLIAGNHAVKEMIEQGFENVIVVPTDGKTLVVTQRVDIDKDSKEGHELALADNRVNQANLNFDVELLRDLEAEFDLDLADLAINIHEDGPYFPTGEDGTSGEQMETSYGEREGVYQQNENIQQNLFPVMAALTKAERLRFDSYKKGNKLKTDTETILHMLNLLSN